MNCQAQGQKLLPWNQQRHLRQLSTKQFHFFSKSLLETVLDYTFQWELEFWGKLPWMILFSPFFLWVIWSASTLWFDSDLNLMSTPVVECRQTTFENQYSWFKLYLGSEVELEWFTLTERSSSSGFPTLLIKIPPFCPTLSLGLTSDQQGVLKEDNFSLSCPR